MSEINVIDRFFSLSIASDKVFDETLDIRQAEPFFDRAVTLIQNHPEHQEQFMDAFEEILKDPEKGPPEFVSYCMHALRWEAMRQRIIRWLEKEPSERVRYVLRKQLEAFDDDWGGVIFYKRFSN